MRILIAMLIVVGLAACSEEYTTTTKEVHYKGCCEVHNHDCNHNHNGYRPSVTPISGQIGSGASASAEANVTINQGGGGNNGKPPKDPKPKGNEGLGNGDDPPPPGHDSNQNDGEATTHGHGGKPGKKT